MDDDLIKKVSVSALAVFSFLAVIFIIFSQDRNEFEEVTLQEVATPTDNNEATKKTEKKTIEDFTGSKYACEENDKFIFVDIYASKGGYKADVAVANANGQYAMAYLTEIIGVGEDKRFEDESNNSLILTKDGEAKVYINDILVAEGCDRR